jgi:hypothetical protein
VQPLDCGPLENKRRSPHEQFSATANSNFATDVISFQAEIDSFP